MVKWNEGLMNISSKLRFALWKLRDRAADMFAADAHRRNIFSRIYRDNAWGDTRSKSGSGSSLVATDKIRQQLPDLMRSYNLESLLDAPCGDFIWMREIVENVKVYIGVDIVPELIDRNNEFFAN